ncbi:hypothetical protein [Halostagnicola sp. A-GB9-2]|uniref:hypothetical protein n=1 Tax=Halostagnicola sp. A-GB9-2 TaxID=3048066 RepID=UPI0024BF37DF|nr:hypothetical protein [Halostagnicola sp. A-GB9-2]MDJ1431082.1 hypothetical protein [Halostagnicola sp. A-GB9-2]
MGVLETMFGQVGDGDGRAKFSSHRYDVTYTVSAESHDIAYAVPIQRAEFDAFADLVELERETAYVTDGKESLEESLDAVLEDDSLDAETWTERMEAPRRTVEPILESWQEIVYGEESDAGADETDDASERNSTGATDGSAVEIVYLPLETESAFAAFLQVCRKRDELGHDPFELPENIAAAAGILTRIKRATDRSKNRVVVNRRHLPEL